MVPNQEEEATVSATFVMWGGLRVLMTLWGSETHQVFIKLLTWTPRGETGIRPGVDTCSLLQSEVPRATPATQALWLSTNNIHHSRSPQASRSLPA